MYTMDLKTDLQHWHKACQAFDYKDYSMALDTLLVCCPSSKIYFNIGVIMVILQDHQHALTVFRKASELDPYFSAAYFQSGVCNIMLGDFRQAIKCFDLTYKSLRGNTAINYRQLGLDFTLYACEILYNRGMCQIYLENIECGMADLHQAQQLKMNNQHEIIDQATRDTERSTFGVYSIPSTVIYRPTECQLRLLEGADSLFSTCYDCPTQRLFILDQHHHHHQSYRHLPKYVSKYLNSVINTKHKENTTTSPKYFSSSNMSHHLYSPIPLSRTHSPLSYLLSTSHQQLKKQQQSPTKQQDEKSDMTGTYIQAKTKTKKKFAFYQQPTYHHHSTLDNIYGKYKVKLHYHDTRIMMIDANTTYQDVLIKIHEKLDLSIDVIRSKLDGLKLHYMDGDGVLQQLMNEEDWSSLKRINRYCDPRQFQSYTKTACVGKIEIWCTS